MKRLILTALALAVAATPSFAEGLSRRPDQSFASDLQTIPVVANLAGANGSTFTTYVAIFNPTASSYAITASLYDSTGTKRDAQINIAGGELKTYTNFLSDVFSVTGGGAVVLRSADSAGGQRNNRFIVSAEVRSGNGYGTSIPLFEFAGSASRSFAAGVSIDSNSRTNIGCFNQSATANTITATVYDSAKNVVGTQTLSLAANAWGQAGVPSVVSGGYIQFDPSASAVCYAVVVNNLTNDGRFISAAEYTP